MLKNFTEQNVQEDPIKCIIITIIVVDVFNGGGGGGSTSSSSSSSSSCTAQQLHVPCISIHVNSDLIWESNGILESVCYGCCRVKERKGENRMSTFMAAVGAAAL